VGSGDFTSVDDGQGQHQWVCLCGCLATKNTGGRVIGWRRTTAWRIGGLWRRINSGLGCKAAPRCRCWTIWGWWWFRDVPREDHLADSPWRIGRWLHPHPQPITKTSLRICFLDRGLGIFEVRRPSGSLPTTSLCRGCSPASTAGSWRSDGCLNIRFDAVASPSHQNVVVGNGRCIGCSAARRSGWVRAKGWRG
jgi:hypothetical protein